MKKALLVLLFLAVAGGLFAQTTVTWSGRLDTRLRARQAYGSDEWGLSWSTIATRLNATIRNNDAGYGGYLSLRPNLNAAGMSIFHSYYGWFNLFDGKVKVLGGKWGAATELEFSEGYWWANSLWATSVYNIGAFFYPMDGLRLGVGAISGSPSKFEDVDFWLGARYDVSEDLSVRAQFRYGEKYGANALFDIVYTNKDLGLTAVLNNNFNQLQDFATKGDITLNQYFNYANVENFDFDLAITEILYGQDGYDPYIDIELDTYYTTGIPGLYLAAVEINFWTGYNGDDSYSYFRIYPYIRFGQSGSRYVGFGYQTTINFDTSKIRNDLILRFYWNF